MISYILLRVFGVVIELLPYSCVVLLSRLFGWLTFYLYAPFRKKSLTNLTIAYGDQISFKRKKQIAIESLQNLALTCLEYFKLNPSFINHRVCVEDQAPLEKFLDKKQGIVFFSGHLGNWEIPFLKATQRFSGLAIAKPVNSQKMNAFLLRKRTMFKGEIVTPKKALRAGVQALKKGFFMGIVGDQALPESSYSYPLLGKRAWTTTAPALLAYKTKSPLVVILTKRERGKHHISYSEIFHPDTTQPIAQECHKLMNLAMESLERFILKNPSQWMWIHDRWKQQRIDHLKREYRFSFILLVIPEGFKEDFSIFKRLYPRSYITTLVPQSMQTDENQTPYTTFKELFLDPWAFQLVIDLSNQPKLQQYYLKKGAFIALNGEDFKQQNISFESAVIHKLCKKVCIENLEKHLKVYD